jgi:hypothetical protein
MLGVKKTIKRSARVVEVHIFLFIQHIHIC